MQDEKEFNTSILQMSKELSNICMIFLEIGIYLLILKVA